MKRIALAALLILPSAALAVPGTMAHQGRLMDTAGTPLTGAHDLTIALWDASASGNELYTETINTEFNNGYFAVVLGIPGGLDETVFIGDSAWAEITIDTSPPIATRLELTSVPWALRATAADTATTADSATTAETATNVSGGVVDATEIRINGTTVIQAGGLGTLSGLNCTTGQVASYDGSAWGCTDWAHTHGAAEVVGGVLDINVIPVGGGAGTVAAGDHTHAAPDWTALTNIPTDIADGDADTLYTAGTGLALNNGEFAMTGDYLSSAGGTVSAEFPAVTFDHPTSGGTTGLTMRSTVNTGSDSAFLLMQDNSAETGGTGTENIRLTLGVYNDFRQSATHSDELWLQGGGRMVYNVGGWDAELDTLIGTPGQSANVEYEWRANDAAVMNLSSTGTLVVNEINANLGCPANMSPVAGGRLCIDDANQTGANAIIAVSQCAAREARVCTYTDAAQACGAGINPFGGAALGWFGDHALATGGNTDDEFLTWNRSTCGTLTALNLDGPGRVYNYASYPYRCCM